MKKVIEIKQQDANKLVLNQNSLSKVKGGATSLDGGETDKRNKRPGTK